MYGYDFGKRSSPCGDCDDGHCTMNCGARLNNSDRRSGRAANLANLRRDPKQNIDWLAGWDDAEDDRRLYLE
jgi:hypothetical protein